MLFVTVAGDYIELLLGQYPTATAYHEAVLKARGYTWQRTTPPIGLLTALAYSQNLK